MAQYPFSETNQANWIGVKPAIIGEQLIDIAIGHNAITNFYTVPANKQLLLFNWNSSFRNESGGVASGYFILFDSAATARYRFHYFTCPDNDSKYAHQEYYIPVVCDAGDYFTVSTSANNARLYSNIHGILQDV